MHPEILRRDAPLNDKKKKNSVELRVLRGAKKSEIINHKSEIKMKKEIVQKILHFVITVLTAIATTFGVTSCMGG